MTMKLTKRKIYYIIVALFIAYLPIVFLCLWFRNNTLISYAFIAGMCIWFGTLTYGMMWGDIISDDHFKSIDELKEEKEKVRALNRKLYNYIRIIGEHEAIKMWNENKNKENEV